MTDAETRAKARGERMSLRKERLAEQEADLEPAFGADAIYREALTELLANT